MTRLSFGTLTLSIGKIHVTVRSHRRKHLKHSESFNHRDVSTEKLVVEPIDLNLHEFVVVDESLGGRGVLRWNTCRLQFGL